MTGSCHRKQKPSKQRKLFKNLYPKTNNLVSHLEGKKKKNLKCIASNLSISSLHFSLFIAQKSLQLGGPGELGAALYMATNRQDSKWIHVQACLHTYSYFGTMIIIKLQCFWRVELNGACFHMPGWPKAADSPEWLGPPASTFQVLGFQACTTVPSKTFFLNFAFRTKQIL